MEERIKSTLRLERLAFEEIQFSRDTSTSLAQFEYEMNFNRELGLSKDGNLFGVKLTLNLWSKIPNLLKVKISLVGYFSCDCENENIKQSLIKYNTLSILFPYIRSQLSLITAQPDITPIVLPPVNIVAMFEAVDKPTEDEE